MTSNPQLSFDKLWLVVAICCIASVGIWQLWRMDMIIYHRLLSACFLEGVELEKQHDFLPKIKTRMLNSVPEKDVTRVLFYYYFFSIAMFILTAFGITIYLKYSSLPFWLILSSLVMLIYALYKMQSSMRIKSKEKTDVKVT